MELIYWTMVAHYTMVFITIARLIRDRRDRIVGNAQHLTLCDLVSNFPECRQTQVFRLNIICSVED